ncbi:MAG: hypothetical protein M3O33_17885 [Cyanobacteriota bacterium]|nr:hypothetical protein [Cyanobacteriota bacterium]
MARAVERIEQDLEALEEAIALLWAEFHSTYSQYLKLLGQGVRQQLILASYQVCTHGYPESFLALSFNQRQKLQEAVRRLGGQAQEEFLSHLEPSKRLPQTDATDIVEEAVNDAPVFDDEQPQAGNQEQLPEPFEMAISLDDALDAAEPGAIANNTPTKPEQLREWQEQLEQAIAQTLQTLSLDTNRILQKNGIIPDKLPPAVLEAAVQVEASEAGAGSPNLLNLLMEAESEGEKEDSTLTRIIAINLRLSEIEFADPTLSAGRNQIRKLSARVSSLQREYYKKQRERAVAQAEAAWRSSWFDG